MKRYETGVFGAARDAGDSLLPLAYPQPVINHTTNASIEMVVVPAAQAVITGLLVAVVLAVIAGWLEVAAWRVFLIAWAGVTLGAWLSYRSRSVWAMERALGLDIHRESSATCPDPPGEPVRLQVVIDREDVGQVDYVYFDLPLEKLRTLARALAAGRDLSEATWTGSNGLLSRGEFASFREQLHSRGLARWRNPDAHSQGTELTPAGRAVMRKIAKYEV